MTRRQRDEFLVGFYERLKGELDAGLVRLIGEQLSRREYAHVYNMIRAAKRDKGLHLSRETETRLEEFYWNYVH